MKKFGVQQKLLFAVATAVVLAATSAVLFISYRTQKESTTPTTSFAGSCAMRFVVAGPTPTPRTYCEGLSSITYPNLTECPMQSTYKTLVITCSDGYQETFTVSTCTGQDALTTSWIPKGKEICQGRANCYYPTPIPTLVSFTPSAAPTPTATTLFTPTPAASTATIIQYFNFRAKFAGIRRDVGPIKAQVIVGSRTTGLTIGRTVVMTHDGGGVYMGTINKNQDLISLSDPLWMSIKGEKHVRITFPSFGIGANGDTVDFTGRILEAGDTPDQDGVVDNQDINRILSVFSKPTTTIDDIKIGDLNYDGVVNAADLSLLLSTLSIRRDESSL